MMKQTFGKAGWLIASIGFFGLACLGVALDDSLAHSPSSHQQPTKQEAVQTKVATIPSQPRKGPEPTAPVPTPAPAAQTQPQPPPQPIASAPAASPAIPAPVERQPEPKPFHGIDEGTPVLTPEMEPHRLIWELEQDKSHYPVEVWCKDVNTCAAKVVRKVKDTQWQIGLFMNEEVYYQTNEKYAAQGYDFGNGHSFTDRNGVVLHQAVWLKNQ